MGFAIQMNYRVVNFRSVIGIDFFRSKYKITFSEIGLSHLSRYAAIAESFDNQI